MSVTQDDFRAALLDAAAPVPAGLTDGAGAPAGRRYNVYRNNVAVSLREALHEGFPTIAKLLGAQNMDGLAGIFLRRHPPSSPLMMLYGEAFPDFLAGMPQLAHLGYLADVARLDLAMRQSYHAADADPIDPADLAALPPERLVETRLTLAPALRLIRSAWPIHAIWRFNTEEGAPRPEPGAQDVVILRPGFDPEPHLLPPGGADVIAALHQGHSLGAALDAATGRVPDFDLTPTLALLLQGGAIIALT
ncbi:MAG: DUF2063 domain-containing protein [Rhodobacteraceae bacterium]|nr:MAG: DUF2063 domain-containing protein [Paracoccaceae bacterium]